MLHIIVALCWMLTSSVWAGRTSSKNPATPPVQEQPVVPNPPTVDPDPTPATPPAPPSPPAQGNSQPAPQSTSGFSVKSLLAAIGIGSTIGGALWFWKNKKSPAAAPVSNPAPAPNPASDPASVQIPPSAQNLDPPPPPSSQDPKLPAVKDSKSEILNANHRASDLTSSFGHNEVKGEGKTNFEKWRNNHTKNLGDLAKEFVEQDLKKLQGEFYEVVKTIDLNDKEAVTKLKDKLVEKKIFEDHFKLKMQNDEVSNDVSKDPEVLQALVKDLPADYHKVFQEAQVQALQHHFQEGIKDFIKPYTVDNAHEKDFMKEFSAHPTLPAFYKDPSILDNKEHIGEIGQHIDKIVETYFAPTNPNKNSLGGKSEQVEKKSEPLHEYLEVGVRKYLKGLKVPEKNQSSVLKMIKGDKLYKELAKEGHHFSSTDKLIKVVHQAIDKHAGLSSEVKANIESNLMRGSLNIHSFLTPAPGSHHETIQRHLKSGVADHYVKYREAIEQVHVK